MIKETILFGSIFFMIGCTSQAIQPEASLPNMVSYSEGFRQHFGTEVEESVCGNLDKNIPMKLPFTCAFINDSLELRANIKGMKDN